VKRSGTGRRCVVSAKTETTAAAAPGRAGRVGLGRVEQACPDAAGHCTGNMLFTQDCFLELLTVSGRSVSGRVGGRGSTVSRRYGSGCRSTRSPVILLRGFHQVNPFARTLRAL